MNFSVRCHASVMAGKVYKNVVITYTGTHAPSQSYMTDTILCKDISVLPFTVESHSTVDYNGIAVIDLNEIIDDIHLSITNLTGGVTRFAAATAKNVCREDGRHSITFYRLG